MTPVAIWFVIPHRKKCRGVLYYLRRVSAVNGGDYVFIGFVVLRVSVCAQRRDVIIILTSLRLNVMTSVLSWREAVSPRRWGSAVSVR